CQKKVSVKEELAGRKCKCPGCGKVLTIPVEMALAPTVEETRTTPPPLGVDHASQGQQPQPPKLDGGGALTHPPSRNATPGAMRHPTRGGPGGARGRGVRRARAGGRASLVR